MDINTLRLAKVGIDGTYKTMVWNLSQNVDRDTMVRQKEYSRICIAHSPTQYSLILFPLSVPLHVGKGKNWTLKAGIPAHVIGLSEHALGLDKELLF